MKKFFIYIASLLTLGFTSCGDFLEEYSQNQRYTKTAQDLDELLMGECFMKSNTLSSIYSQTTMSHGSGGLSISYPWLHVMDDDAEEYVMGGLPTSADYPRNVLGSFFRWGIDPWVTLENFQFKDNDWEDFYEYIGALNSIIYYANEFRATDPNLDLLDRVEGEARFLRAGYYFMLANIYGMPYCKATASQDMSVPLKISEKIEDKYFSRNSVEEVYNQIVADLEQATVCLKGVTPASTLRVGESAAYALLSRVYLYMERYDDCVKAANTMMEENYSYSVMDLNKWQTGENFISWVSPETIFTQGGCSITQTFLPSTMDYTDWANPTNQALSFKVSEDLIKSYDNADLRPNVFFKGLLTPDKYKSWSEYSNTDKVGTDFIIRLPEVILNKAEALAMLGKDGEAKTELNKLLSKRFATAPSVTATGNDLIQYIRDERRRELCFEGHRWFDLRRYAVNSILPLPDSYTLRHRHNELNANDKTWYDNGYYELQSYAKDKAAWMVPIPRYAIEFNKGALVNEVRPNRELKK